MDNRPTLFLKDLYQYFMHVFAAKSCKTTIGTEELFLVSILRIDL